MLHFKFKFLIKIILYNILILWNKRLIKLRFFKSRRDIIEAIQFISLNKFVLHLNNLISFLPCNICHYLLQDRIFWIVLNWSQWFVKTLSFNWSLYCILSCFLICRTHFVFLEKFLVYFIYYFCVLFLFLFYFNL